MKRLTAIAMAGAFACAVGVGEAQAQAADYEQTAAWTGAQLGEMCGAKPDSARGIAAINLCHGYARGAVAAYTQLQLGSRRPLKLFCLPPADTVSATAVLSDYVAWVKTAPEHAKERAVDALFAFLAIKFPCGKS
jgi:hypothetical protein